MTRKLYLWLSRIPMHNTAINKQLGIGEEEEEWGRPVVTGYDSL
jgi:hypothetical protein